MVKINIPSMPLIFDVSVLVIILYHYCKFALTIQSSFELNVLLFKELV